MGRVQRGFLMQMHRCERASPDILPATPEHPVR